MGTPYGPETVLTGVLAGYAAHTPGSNQGPRRTFCPGVLGFLTLKAHKTDQSFTVKGYSNESGVAFDSK